MATIRVQKNKDYSVINNTGLNDVNLTFKAKGILAYLLSKPDNWKCQVSDLVLKAKDGRDSVYAGLKELRESGYLIKRPIKVKGKVSEWEEILFETPQEEAIAVFKEQAIKNELATLKRAETIKRKKLKPLTGNPDMDKTTYGKSVNGNSVTGKAVNIISTNLPSTNLPNTNLEVVAEPHIYLIKYFEDNICELRPSTKENLNKYIDQLDPIYIETVMNYCAEINTRSFAGFKIAIDSSLKNEANTAEKFEAYILKFREDKKNKKVVSRSNKKDDTWITGSERPFDHSMEGKLLGLDKNVV